LWASSKRQINFAFAFATPTTKAPKPHETFVVWKFIVLLIPTRFAETQKQQLPASDELSSRVLTMMMLPRCEIKWRALPSPEMTKFMFRPRLVTFMIFIAQDTQRANERMKASNQQMMMDNVSNVIYGSHHIFSFMWSNIRRMANKTHENRFCFLARSSRRS